jgi:hypothetical protein
MPDLSQLLNQAATPTGARGQTALRGVIRKAPASDTDTIEVIAQGYTAQVSYQVPPGHWTPRGAALPELNASCLIVFDEAGDAYLASYTGENAFGGTGSGDLNYVHTQGTPSASWVVAHGLGKYASVEVVDTGDSVVIPTIHYDSTNQLTLSFGSPTSGKAFVN